MVKVGALPRQSPPAIRVRPVPAVDPPFDDEVALQPWAAAFGAAPLSTDHSTDPGGWPGPTAVAPGQPGRRPDADRTGPRWTGTWHPWAAGDQRGDPTAAVERRRGVGPDLAGASAEARNAVRRFLGICLEILNGYRPAGQLRPLAGPAEAAAVIDQVSAAVARVTELRRAAGRPARTVRPEANPVRVRRLRVCEPRPGAAEATAVLLTAGRTWALAFRLERRDGTWAATVARLV